MAKKDRDETAKKDEYGPDVYKRLELVRKQFKHSTATRKKQESAERRQATLDHIRRTLRQNRVRISHTVLYVVLAILVISVIVVVIFIK